MRSPLPPAPSGSPIRGWLCAATTGVLLGFSFPPYPFAALAWGALVPLLWRWTRVDSMRRFVCEVYGAFFLAFGIAFHWVAFHADPITALASVGGLLLGALAFTLPWVVASWIRGALGAAAALTGLVATHVSIEWLLGQGEWALPWILLGHSQATATPMNQMADLVGVPGLTLWLWGINLALFGIVTAGIRWRYVAILALLVTGPWTYGSYQSADRYVTDTSTEAIIVQPGVEAPDWADLHDQTRVEQLLALSDSTLRAHGAAVDVVIWPETALPAFPTAAERQALAARLQAWTEAHNVSLLTGANIPLEPEVSRPVFANVALHVAPHVPPVRYDKLHLVPFAERVPFVDRFPALRALTVPAGGIATYRPGTQVHPLSIGAAHVGVQICFESVFGAHGRALVSPPDPADFLVVLSHDGWWGATLGHQQHLDFTRLRAIETRRPVAMVTVSGTTALIEPDGQSTLEIGWMDARAEQVTIPHTTGDTIYTRYGDMISPLGLATVLGLVLAAAIRRLRRP